MKDLNNTYLFKALESYPYELTEAIEALTYALSYDQENRMALRLMAQIYSEQLDDKEMAIEYYQKAIAIDVYSADIYPSYINELIQIEDFKGAFKAIEFALTLKGTDKAHVYYLQAIIFEYKREYKKALSNLKEAKKHAYNSFFITFLEGNEKRVKEKTGKKKKKAKKKKSKKKKKKKTK